MEQTQQWPADLGPRQAKQVKEALAAMRQESQTQVAINGVVGGEERRHAFVQIFGTYRHPRYAELYQEIRTQFPTLTRDNYQAAIKAIEAATATMRGSRVEHDKRITADEASERQRAQMVREAEEHARQEAAAASWAVIDAKRPAWAEAVIVAEEREDTSDPYSDYCNHRTVRRVAIGWRSGKREDFRQLRAAARAYAATANLDCDEAEKRENYSMGAGNYLALSRNSGWAVKSYEFRYTGNRYHVIEDALPERTEAAGAPVERAPR